MHGESPLFLPALDGALIAAEEGGYFFPGIETAFRRLLLGNLHKPEMS